METQRRARLEAFFSQPPAAHEKNWLSAGIQLVLNLDSEIMQLGKAGRQELGETLNKLGNGRVAVKAYQAHTP
jgi:hypothetical protein